MSIRDKIAAGVQPMLAPGEQIQAAFPAQSGPTPYLAALTWLLMFMNKYVVIVATDRRIVIYRTGTWKRTVPIDEVATLPRTTQIGPVKGIWSAVQLGGQRYWVHKRFHKDVEAANQLATAAPAAAAAPGIA